MAVQFPSPAVDGQVYPDINNGDATLDNGRIYVYDAGRGVWNLDTPVAVGGGGALQVSAVPKLVHHDNFERYKGAIWDYKNDDGTSYKVTSRTLSAPVIHDEMHYWDGRWWTVFKNKEYGSDVYTSDDGGDTWTPHSRIARDVDFQPVGYASYYIGTVEAFFSNDDCMMIALQTETSSSGKQIVRIKKGEDSFTKVWSYRDLNVNYFKAVGVVDGNFYYVVENRQIMRSFDNGDSWDVVDMTLTNGEPGASYAGLYYSNNYHNIFGLPDGRLATKWGVVAPGETSYSYHIIASNDQGETWEIVDLDWAQTYKYSSGVAERAANTNSETGAWTANGVVFNSVGFREVDEKDCLEERHGTLTNYVLFYTTDISSGVWTPVEGNATYKSQTLGFYNPNDKRYYSITQNGAIQCSQPGSITSKGWGYLDKAGTYGFAISGRMKKGNSSYFDELNNRLAFLFVGTSTFDYYTFEPAIQGIGDDEYQNRLVTFRELDGYLKAPNLERTGGTNSSQEARLTYPATRGANYGKNAPYTAMSHLTPCHRYYIAKNTYSDSSPKTGQCQWIRASQSSSNSSVPCVGRGYDGWFAVSIKDLYRNWSIGSYRLQTYQTKGSSEKTIKTNGALYFSNGPYRNGSTNGYPQCYFIIPFTQFSVKRDVIYVDLKRSDIIWSALWYTASTNYPGSMYDLEENMYYLYHAEGIFFNYHSYNNQGGAGYMEKKMLEY